MEMEQQNWRKKVILTHLYWLYLFNIERKILEVENCFQVK